MAKNTRSVTRARGRGGSSRTPTIAAIVAVVIVAAVVFGGVFLFQGGGASSAPIEASPVQASYTTTVQDGVIVAGQGPRTLDVYEDALCPACQQFEALDGQRITESLNAGKLTVRYHMVNLLDKNSNPPGYSTLGGNALICAAENNAFPVLHKTLYDRQPPESGKGYTAEQLAALGPNIGAGPGYQGCVQSGTHSAAVAQNFQQAVSDPKLQQSSGSFGTPTVVLDGKLVEPGSPELEGALA